MPETLSTRRLRWLLWGILFWVGAIFARLVTLQVFRHDELLKLAQQQQQKMVEIQAMRGTIFDRTGQPLAKTLPAESICVNPSRIPDPGVAADLLSRVLDLDRATLFGKISSAKSRNRGFMWVKRKVSSEEAARMRSLKLDWVEFRPEMRRFYPHGELAAHVLGSVGIVDPDDVVEHGNAGIEMSFDDELAGRPGLARVYNDVRQNAYDSVVARQPEPGTDLTLTIDPNLQYDAERTLEAAAKKSGAASGTLVALNPYTGEILAMANYPTYDPNGSPDGHEPSGARSDLAVSTPFEPGSVFKVITLAAALETTNLTPDTMINCGNGSINLFGRIIHDHKAYSSLSMADVLAHSSNIGAIQIGLKVGQQRLYDYVRKFGFGRKTGIDLPGESAGMLRRLSQWEPSSIGSVAMGHEVGATSIQLALAGAIVANGGMRVKPRLILARQKPGGAEVRYAPEKPERVIRPETAIKLRQMMEGVVLRGTGKGLANLRGYTSGGKTGSAQIYDFKLHAYTHHYNASFLGFAPVANPQIVIAVTLIGTSGGSAGYGGPVAAPVFREVATSALRMLDVPKDLPDTDTHLAKAAKPDEEDDLSIAGLGAAPVELMGSNDLARDGWMLARSQSVSSVTLPPVQEGLSASAAEPSLDRRPFLTAQGTIGPKVPDLRGMTLRAVLEESAATGLKVEVLGDGMARAQDPPPGAVLAPGTRIRVRFTR
jgi:cell division protein FtsI (penicillin-binding protein 3)